MFAVTEVARTAPAVLIAAKRSHVVQYDRNDSEYVVVLNNSGHESWFFWIYQVQVR